jgi:hypothetical protein
MAQEFEVAAGQLGQTVKIDGRTQLDGSSSSPVSPELPLRGCGTDAADAEVGHDGCEDVGAGEQIFVAGASAAAAPARRVDVKHRFWGQVWQEVAEVADDYLEMLARLGRVEFQASGADGRKFDGGDGGTFGEGQGVSSDAGAQIDDFGCSGGGEAPGFPASDDQVGGLLEGFGGGP